MSVSWVGGTTSAYVASGTTVNATIPTVQDDDCLIAFYFGRSAVTTPSGWALIASQACTAPGVTQTLYAFVKESVASSDSGTTLTVTQASSNRAGLTIAAARASVDAVLIEVVGTVAINSTSTVSITPSAVTGVGDGELALLSACDALANTTPTTTTITAPSGSTLWSGSALDQNRLGGAYWALDASDATSGSFVWSVTPTQNGLAAISLRLFDGIVGGYASDDEGITQAPPPAEGLGFTATDGYLDAESILGTASAQGILGTNGGWVSTAGPLGPEQLIAQATACWASASGPLGPELGVAWHDFSSQVASSVDSYVCDLTGGASDLRVPISSWQATLQTDRQQYLQVVIPAVSGYVSEITARAGAGGEIVITRICTAPDGSSVSYEMARGPIQSVRLDRGSLNYSGTLSGYTSTDEDTLAGSKTVTLRGVRTISTTTVTRARADIDWLLRPGMTVIADTSTFTADWISIYLSGMDAYMDCGERGA